RGSWQRRAGGAGRGRVAGRPRACAALPTGASGKTPGCAERTGRRSRGRAGTRRRAPGAAAPAPRRATPDRRAGPPPARTARERRGSAGPTRSRRARRAAQAARKVSPARIVRVGYDCAISFSGGSRSSRGATRRSCAARAMSSRTTRSTASKKTHSGTVARPESHSSSACCSTLRRCCSAEEPPVMSVARRSTVMRSSRSMAFAHSQGPCLVIVSDTGGPLRQTVIGPSLRRVSFSATNQEAFQRRTKKPLSRRIIMRSAYSAAAAAVLSLAALAPAYAASDVVISQIYGGGGNAGATLKNDFIEIFNRGNTPASLANWSVQYAAAASANWQVTLLAPSVTLAPGQYLLIQEAAGAGGSVDLPAADATGGIAMAAG